MQSSLFSVRVYIILTFGKKATAVTTEQLSSNSGNLYIAPPSFDTKGKNERKKNCRVTN